MHGLIERGMVYKNDEFKTEPNRQKAMVNYCFVMRRTSSGKGQPFNLKVSTNPRG